MKKDGSAAILIITLAAVAFTMGLFLGRFSCRDGVSITVVTRPTTDPQVQTTSAAQIGKVNINTAEIDTLQLLPGIGPALAQRIIEFREENGSFQSVEDLKEVSGIGDKLYEALCDYISVGG